VVLAFNESVTKRILILTVTAVASVVLAGTALAVG
jgi:hypothetical protein